MATDEWPGDNPPPVWSPDGGDTLYVNAELKNALRKDVGLPPIGDGE